jgi:hypothetical protein
MLNEVKHPAERPPVTDSSSAHGGLRMTLDPELAEGQAAQVME